jgi:anaerobic selenocysteine-containing dehydrogenase
MKKKKKFNRRNFLKGSAAGIGGLLALETLKGCSPSLPPEDGDGEFVPGPDVHGEFPVEFSESLVATTCWIGKQDCGMFCRVLTQTTADGKEVKRIVGVEGHPDNPRNKGTLCPKGVAQIQAVYDYNRIKTPLRRTNRKGEPGRFVQISWDEALSTVANELRDSSTKGTPVLWQKGRSKAKKFYDTAFVNTLKNAGIPTAKFGHGAYCSDSGYRACEYNLGLHGVLHPDFRHVKYLLSWGWGLTTSGGNKYCWLTWPQFFQEARANNLKKVVAFDPFRRGTGPHADEWLAPKPGTDTAFFLGLSHYLLTNDFLDQVYLRDHTNSPFLVKADGMFARRDVGGEMKELVWDTATDQAVPFDTAGAVPALDGEYDVDGEMVKPSLERLKDLLVSNGWTPDWADGVCGLPALTTARIARELYENAHIGETITIEGTTFPYRPVAIMGYHVTQQELGFTACRAAIQVLTWTSLWAAASSSPSAAPTRPSSPGRCSSPPATTWTTAPSPTR